MQVLFLKPHLCLWGSDCVQISTSRSSEIVHRIATWGGFCFNLSRAANLVLSKVLFFCALRCLTVQALIPAAEHVCAEMLDWLLTLSLCMIVGAHQLLSCKRFHYNNSKRSMSFSVWTSFSLFLCVFASHPHPADQGSPAGPHGEGGLAGPADLQRDWDDQWGEMVWSNSVSKLRGFLKFLFRYSDR